ncbi:MAG TPA: phosphatidylglycerophosphatase A [Bryobacteraceae bacterium]|jgi:phosphatidylglycerophosphatase A|nr:phosphatidylglycerophosphatase A [Bryobacteraceae bacterium]
MKIKAAKMIATWFGCGYAPIGPGTAGSIAALAIAWLLVRYAGWQPLWFVALVLVCAPPFIWAAGVTAHALNQKDPGVVVADEVLGQWLALAGARPLNVKSWLGAFILFRLFDIWKPIPVRNLENLPGGTGIVADDLMAGVYAALVLSVTGCFNLY